MSSSWALEDHLGKNAGTQNGFNGHMRLAWLQGRDTALPTDPDTAFSSFSQQQHGNTCGARMKHKRGLGLVSNTGEVSALIRPPLKRANGTLGRIYPRRRASLGPQQRWPRNYRNGDEAHPLVLRMGRRMRHPNMGSRLALVPLRACSCRRISPRRLCYLRGLGHGPHTPQA